MGTVIGDILPLAVGVAISPVPVIAAILLLLSPQARAASVGFMLGWVVGIATAVGVFAVLSSFIPAKDPDASTPVVGTVQIILGLLLLVMAAAQWRKRPEPGEPAALPKWMQAVDKITFPVALGLGFALAAINPKNLLMAASAGLVVGSAALSAGSVVVVVAVFTLIAASTVLVPVIGYLLAAEKLRNPLSALREWLTRENTVIMTVLLLVIGVSMIGKGIGSF